MKWKGRIFWGGVRGAQVNSIIICTFVPIHFPPLDIESYNFIYWSTSIYEEVNNSMTKNTPKNMGHTKHSLHDDNCQSKNQYITEIARHKIKKYTRIMTDQAHEF